MRAKFHSGEPAAVDAGGESTHSGQFLASGGSVCRKQLIKKKGNCFTFLSFYAIKSPLMLLLAERAAA